MKHHLSMLLFGILLFQLSPHINAQKLPLYWHFNEDSSRMYVADQALEGLYDLSQIKELKLYFTENDYWQKMIDNHDTENFVSATLHYEGEYFDSVAVQFKGQTSFRRPVKQGSEKLSFSIKLNEIIDGQDIDAYNNLNLNNADGDFSFMKEVLYGKLSRTNLPALKGNYIKLFLNDEYWGIYTNIQQLNGDYIEEWLPENDGIRWRADGPLLTDSATTNKKTTTSQWGDGTAALNYHGEDLAVYQQFYTLKDSGNIDNPWKYLIEVCDILNNTDSASLIDSLEKVMDIDATLWFLAQEIVFSDDDSYIHKGKMDYYLYWDPISELMFPLEFDGNSAMASINVDWSPFINQDNPNYPLLNRLLSNPLMRQRYIAHVKTIVTNSFIPSVYDSEINALDELIRPLLAQDPKIMFNVLQHDRDVSRLRSFFEDRPGIIYSYPDFQHQAPEIYEVVQTSMDSNNKIPSQNEAVVITAEAGHSMGIKTMNLYYGTGIRSRFQKIEMNDDGINGDENAGDHRYSGIIPGFGNGTMVRYYIEAIAKDSSGSIKYKPEGASYDVFVYQINVPYAGETSIVINEVLCSNSGIHKDEYGESDDYIELFNLTNYSINLEGYHLSDNKEDIYKWKLPDVDIEANGYKLIWADNDPEQGELHANFKLSASGESIYLTNSDSAIVDELTYNTQSTNISFGRWENGNGEFMNMMPTPGEVNTNTRITANKVRKPSSVMIYPNPSKGILHLKTNSNYHEKIYLYGMSGAILWEGAFQEKIDFSWVQAGIYVLRIDNEWTKIVLQ